MSPKTADRPALSRNVVADRALELADSEGIEAVTVRRLATELGVTPMALYWHFRTKEDLLAGLGDRVLDALEIPESTGEWVADLRAALAALVTAMRPHPQVAGLAGDRILAHPQGLLLTERALSLLSGAGFGQDQAGYLAVQALRSAISMVTAPAVDDSGMTPQERDEDVRRKQAHLAYLSPETFPALRAHAAALTYCPDADTFFDLAMDLYIAGVQGLAASVRPR